MSQDESTSPESPDPEARRARRRRRRWLMFTGLPLLAIGGAFAARALADHRGWGHHRGDRGASTEQALRERMGHGADRMARHLDLSASQRRQIDAILDTHSAKLFAMKQQRKQLHNQLFDAIKSGDQARIEAARKAGIDHFDAATKVWTEMGVLAYDVLDADQRAEVMEHFERFAPHGHPGHPGH